MNNDKPKNINEYKKWLKDKHNTEISNRTKVYYESVTTKIQQTFEKSNFWVRLTEGLKKFASEYQLKTQYPLLLNLQKPKLDIKPFESFLLKTFRKNILENEHWPDEPEDGWILPNNWYSRINDIVRTLIKVKYLDGVEFMIDKIKNVCGQYGLPCDAFLRAREDGYYAAHLYTRQEFEIPRVTWNTKRVRVFIEIQITTQLQELIRQLLHKYYEEKRRRLKEKHKKWQWDYKSNEFVANYLGHILHYVEGMVMEIREKQKKK